MKPKMKRLFSALMSLAMILSLCTFALAVDLPAGSSTDEEMTVSAVTGAPAALSGATIAYTADEDNGSVTLGNVSVSGWNAAWKSGESLTLGSAASAVAQLTDGTDTVEVTITITGDAADMSGTITLGTAANNANTRPPVAANTDGQFNSYAEDSADGTVSNEGEIPPDVINVVVPADSASDNAFDLYLDPHGLLKKTSGKRYAESANDTVSLTGNANVYFKTAANTFANESKALTITNKSSVKVGVDLSVAVTKGNNAFTFVDSTDAVASAEGAAIYLAVKSGTTTKAVPDTADENGDNIGVLATSIDTDEHWYTMEWHGTKDEGYYSYDMVDPAPESFKDISFSLVAQINDDEAWDVISTFPLAVIWDVKEYEEPAADDANNGGGGNAPVAADTEPDATVGTAFSGAGSTLTINLTWGSGDKAKAHAKLVTNKTAVDTIVDAPAATLTATAPTQSFQYNGLEAAANVIFYNDTVDEADAVTVAVTIK